MCIDDNGRVVIVQGRKVEKERDMDDFGEFCFVFCFCLGVGGTDPRNG